MEKREDAVRLHDAQVLVPGIGIPNKKLDRHSRETSFSAPLALSRFL